MGAPGMTQARLRRVAAGTAKGLVIKPLLMDYLLAGRYPKRWTVSFSEDSERAPDGWFHPSSAPSMGDRQLYLYMTEPEKWEREPVDYVGRMSMFMGSALGDFLRMALEDMGLTIPPKGTCVACGLQQPQECREHGVIDQDLGARGHMDGILPKELFELKSTSGLNLLKVPEMDQVFFAGKWPKYYRQVHDYMRMSGYRKCRVLFFAIGNPWELKEYLIEYDEATGAEIEAGYRRVRLAQVQEQMPEPCCAPGSATARACPAGGCPVHVLSLAGRK
jgi:hypothetical protein